MPRKLSQGTARSRSPTLAVPIREAKRLLALGRSGGGSSKRWAHVERRFGPWPNADCTAGQGIDKSG
jgi:hypothetical protein